MKNKLIQSLLAIVSISILAACGPHGGASAVPVSVLSGQTVYFTYGVANSATTSTYQFSPAGTFILTETYPKTCFANGSWIDNTPGAYAGTVTLTIDVDSCNPTVNGRSLTSAYTVSNNVILFN
jgi:hypothetical protein